MALVRPQQIRPRFSEIGRLYKGSPKRTNANGKEIFGEDLDHFRFEPSPRLLEFPAMTKGFSSLHDELKTRYAELGEKPRTIRVRFAHPEPELNFSTDNEVWKQVKGVERCTRRCNGETCSLHTTDKGTLSKEPIACAAVEGLNKCPQGCVPTGRLRFFLPDLNYPGIVALTTHSIHDISEILGNLEAYANFDLTKIPFKLCRTEKTINRTDEQGNTFPMRRWLCHLEIDPEFGLLLQRSQENRYRAELQAPIEVAALPAMRSAVASDLSHLIEATSLELTRVGWSAEDGRRHLKTMYGKQSRQLLTELELEQFLEFLRSLPTAVQV